MKSALRYLFVLMGGGALLVAALCLVFAVLDTLQRPTDGTGIIALIAGAGVFGGFGALALWLSSHLHGTPDESSAPPSIERAL